MFWKATLGLLRSSAVKWFATPILALAAYLNNPWDSKLDDEPTIWSSANPLPPRPPLAPKSQGWEEFQVQSGITLQHGLMLLNDRANFREPGTKTVTVDTKKVPGTDGMDGRQLVGKRIIAKGPIVLYKGQPQLRAATLEVK